MPASKKSLPIKALMSPSHLPSSSWASSQFGRQRDPAFGYKTGGLDTFNVGLKADSSCSAVVASESGSVLIAQLDAPGRMMFSHMATTAVAARS